MPKETFFILPGDVIKDSPLARLVAFLVRPNTKGLSDCKCDVWLPKSQTRVVTENPFKIELPEWLLTEKEKAINGRFLETVEGK